MSVQPSPQPTYRGVLPAIWPLPAKASMSDMLPISALVAGPGMSSALRALLGEIAADARIPVASVPSPERGEVEVTYVTNASLAPQSYRLEVAPAGPARAVTIQASDEAGAYYALLSLAQLVVVDGATIWLRGASVQDAPGFGERGAILDPWVPPDVGITEASKAELLARVRLGVKYKLNLLDLPDRVPWPELVQYCDAHHVELLCSKGTGSLLTDTPRSVTKAQLDELLDLGVRSFSFNWDDIPVTDPVALATQQAAILVDLYEHVRSRNATAKVSAVLTPYGGVPGKNLFASRPGDGERYLAVIHDALPEDVLIWWTGDDGAPFSPTVSTSGARAYAEAAGHSIGLWDNDSIPFSKARQPCQGRAADLATVAKAYKGNFSNEANWNGTDGHFALLTQLAYNWNPQAYDPAAAAETANRLLGTP